MRSLRKVVNCFKLNTTQSSGSPKWSPSRRKAQRATVNGDDDIVFGDTMTEAEQQASYAGYALASRIISAIRPRHDDASPRFPGNWPNDAVMAVDYTCHDRQFPDVDHGRTQKYFPSVQLFEDWANEKKEWVKSTDFDFSVTYDMYSWDLGPVYLDTRSI